MSILSAINKIINDTDMLLWYKEEYIQFVIDHIDDIIETSHLSEGVWYYMVYIPLDYHPNNVSCTRETCIEWMLNNDKIRRVVYSDDIIDVKYCYSDDFLKDSDLIAHILDAYWLKLMSADGNVKMSNPASNNSYTWTMKVDYSKNMKPELAKVYYSIS